MGLIEVDVMSGDQTAAISYPRIPRPVNPCSRGSGTMVEAEGKIDRARARAGSQEIKSRQRNGIWSRHRLLTGDTVWWADCTDGWRGKDHLEYDDARHRFGEHHGLQHGKIVPWRPWTATLAVYCPHRIEMPGARPAGWTHGLPLFAFVLS